MPFTLDRNSVFKSPKVLSITTAPSHLVIFINIERAIPIKA